MNILLIFPRINYLYPHVSTKNEFLNKIFGEAVSLTLPQVAAATPQHHSVEIVDENYEPLSFTDDVDLVGITCCTMTAMRAYEIADRFRSLHVPVVIGGTHATAVPAEAKIHADSVVVGEAELTWPRLLKDFEEGGLQPFYVSTEAIPSESIPEPRRDLIKRKLFSDGLLIKRGCPNHCEFCSIASLSSKDIRPLENVLREIQHISSKDIFIYDSNLTWNMEYNQGLFQALKKLDKRWQANGTINILGRDDNFLDQAKEIGLYNWFIGFESVSQKSLDSIKKTHNRVDEYDAAIKKIKDHGMVIVGSFIFGFDGDTVDIFDTTLQALQIWEVEMAEFHILTPFPGTVLFDRLKKENRILTQDWNAYTYVNVVYKPKNMTREQLYNGTRRIALQFYSLPNVAKRFLSTLKRTKNLYLSYYVLMRNLKYRERYKNQFALRKGKKMIET
jgi:radical SAM superfamily enzyme YgiQ (UPF0313 family)